MIKLSGELVMVDVDETLVKWEGTTYKPMINNINALIRHANRGHKVIVWSAGGHDWAHRVVKELKLEQYVYLVCSKARWFLDDKQPQDWCEIYWLPDNKPQIKE